MKDMEKITREEEEKKLSQEEMEKVAGGRFALGEGTNYKEETKTSRDGGATGGW